MNHRVEKNSEGLNKTLLKTLFPQGKSGLTLKVNVYCVSQELAAWKCIFLASYKCISKPVSLQALRRFSLKEPAASLCGLVVQS